MTWLNDLGLQRPKMRHKGYHSIPNDEIKPYEAGCISRGGIWRPSHEYDRDLKCYWCSKHRNAGTDGP